MSKISVVKSFNVSKNVFKKNWLILVYALVFPMLFSFVVDQFYHVGDIDNTNFSLYYMGPIFLFYILKFLIDTMFKIGKFKINLDALDGKKPRYSELFSPKNNYFNFLFVSILLGLSTLGGTILLIVPGIYIILTYCFAPILVLDKGLNISESFAKSKEMTQGNKVKMLGYYSVYGSLAFLFLLGSSIIYSILKNPISNLSNFPDILNFAISLVLMICIITLLILSNLAIFQLYRELLNESVLSGDEEDSDNGQMDFKDISEE